MRQEHIKFLICPTCKQKLTPATTRSENAEIIEGTLSCGRHTFPVTKGVAVFTPEQNSTGINFGYEWNKFTSFFAEYEHQFLDWIFPVQKEFFKQKIIFDAGCGNGRHAFLAGNFGAKLVFAVDISNAVFPAKKLCKNLPNVEVIKADITQLPFNNETFDYTYSIGVLHHLSEPKKGFSAIIDKTKKNGVISAWVYGQENNFTLRLLNPLRRLVFRNTPKTFNYALSFLIASLLHPIIHLYGILHKLQFSNKLTKYIPQYHLFVYFSKLPFHVTHNTVFDQMSAPIAHYLKRSELEFWRQENNLKNFLVTWRNKNSWRIYAVKS
ncbi:MAG: methyltransferase domain-containing protein [Candidatus Aenigmarchaeota archaeon]|nr:methyltransferase domain-containing protein [Candidatus Aenigmarchaeota archaeon]